jgi:DNA helicase HerA-like ATPase
MTDYKNGIGVDGYGHVHARTLGTIEPQRLARAYLRLIEAYRPSDGTSSRNGAIDATARRIAGALAFSLSASRVPSVWD